MCTTSFTVAASSSRFTMKLRLNTYAQYENIDLCAETKSKRVSGVRGKETDIQSTHICTCSISPW